MFTGGQGGGRGAIWGRWEKRLFGDYMKSFCESFENCKALWNLKNLSYGSSLVANCVHYPALSLQQLEFLLWCRFDPWPGNFCMPWAWPKKESFIQLKKNLKNAVMESDHVSLTPLLRSCSSHHRLLAG